MPEEEIPDEIKEKINDKDSLGRKRAVKKLVEYGEEALPYIEKIFERKDNSTIEIEAARTLGKMIDKGVDKEKIEEKLITGLQEGYWETRGHAAQKLGEIGTEKSIDPVMKALENEQSSYVRWNAGLALKKIDKEKAVKPLAEALKHESENARNRLAKALEEIGEEVGEEEREGAIKSLMETRKETDDEKHKRRIEKILRKMEMGRKNA